MIGEGRVSGLVEVVGERLLFRRNAKSLMVVVNIWSLWVTVEMAVSLDGEGSVGGRDCDCGD